MSQQSNVHKTARVAADRLTARTRKCRAKLWPPMTTNRNQFINQHNMTSNYVSQLQTSPGSAGYLFNATASHIRTQHGPAMIRV
jgi:hypothetical protein